MLSGMALAVATILACFLYNLITLLYHDVQAHSEKIICKWPFCRKMQPVQELEGCGIVLQKTQIKKYP
jgi:hypothetical protein